MTKAKAIKLMKLYSREVIDPSLALKIAQAFGYNLTQLGIKSKKLKDFTRLNYLKEGENLSAVSVHDLAAKIACHGFDKVFDNPEHAKECMAILSERFPQLAFRIWIEDIKNYELSCVVKCPLSGAGSSAQYIVEKSIEVIAQKQLR